MKTLSPTLACLIVLSFAIVSCGGNGGDATGNTDPNDNAHTSVANIGPEGGTIESTDGLLRLDIPAGALSEPMTISMERFVSTAETVQLYELLPAGLEFAIPAAMTADVTHLMNASDASALRVDQAPVILSTSRGESGIEMLQGHTLAIDPVAETYQLRANVEHFSSFLLGGKFSLHATLEGVPQYAQANAPIDTVELVVDGTLTDDALSRIVYTDASSGSVIYNGQRPTELSPVTFQDNAYSAALPYACGDPQTGEFNADVLFQFFSTQIKTHYSSEYLDIGAIFFKPIFGKSEYFTREPTRSTLSTHIDSYRLTAKRSIDCNAPDVVVDPLTPPTASVSSNRIEILHIIGQTECPTFADPIDVFSDSPNPTAVFISEDVPFLDIDASASTENERAFTLQPRFTCSDFAIGDNRGTVSVTVTDNLTGLTSEPVLIEVITQVN